MRPSDGDRTSAGYSGTPLPAKLGIKPGDVVGLVGAPRDFSLTLGDLPPGVTLRFGARGTCSALIRFVRSQAELDKNIKRFAARANDFHPWIAWQKGKRRASLGEKAVREAALAAGLVDFKICAFDGAWSGLRFALRKAI